MEPASIFMDIFSRLWREKNPDELHRLLTDAPTKYLRDPPSDRKGLILSQLFDRTEGILRFLQMEVDQQNSRPYSAALKQAFDVVDFLIKEYLDVYEPYVKLTLEICGNTLEIKSGYYIKRSAMIVIKNLLINFPRIEDELLDRIVENLMKKIRLYEKKEQALLLRTLCFIAKYRPDLQQIQKEEKRIKKLLINSSDLNFQDVKKQGYAAFQFCIESLTDLLHNFPIDNEQSKSLYLIIKQVSEFTGTPNKSQFLLIESIVLFMIEMMPKFQDLIKNHYKYWNDFFQKLIKINLHTDLAIKALGVYYEVMGKILTLDTIVRNRVILNDLKNSFEKKLKNEYENHNYQRVDVIGYSKIVEAIKKLSGDDGVEEMFQLISKRTSPLYLNEEDAHEKFEDISVYQESLSMLLTHLSSVTMIQVKTIIKLTTLMIKRFAELSESARNYTIDSLKRTIVNMSKLKLYLYKEFVESIIFDGIVWTCSHTLFIDAELQRDILNTRKGPISYKNYVQLWKGLLLNPGNNQEDFNDCRQFVVDKLFETCLKLSSKLNLKIKTKDDNVFYDPALSEAAENETDYRIFLNMIDLYDEILDFIFPIFWTNKIAEFVYKIITASYKSPLISGYYRLINRAINSSQVFSDNYYDDQEMFNTVLEFLSNTTDKVGKYPLELQVVVLQLILQVPEIFMSHLVDRVDAIFKMSLKIGLNDYDFANVTLDSLEKYMSSTDPKKFKKIIQQIIPSLNLYLKSNESLEIHQEVNTIVGKKLQKNVAGFEKLQDRILLLFGRIDNSLMLEFLHNESQHTGASWDDKNLLEYSMTFPDGSLDVYLDSVLPRIIELSLSSSDRRTKVAAGEVLHSIISIILGKTVHFLASNPDRYSSLYKLLCPALLKLGCDSDDVIKQLFNPLMLQLTHWLSNRLMRDSPASNNLINCLFDGLCDESNNLIRDFSGLSLAEFAKWTIKQSSDRHLSEKSNFLNTISSNIKNFSLHSWSQRRIAAAIAFNHLYKILRENERVVNIFWLEFFYCFVKSLDGCDDKCIRDALAHVERVFIERADIFMEDYRLRIVPGEFTGGTLIHGIYWLFFQCGKFERSAAKHVMTVFENITSKIGALGSPQEVIVGFIEVNGFEQFEDVILGKLNKRIVEITEEWLKNILRTLDIYNWLLQRKLVSPSRLFASSNPQSLVIFACIKKFINSVGKMNALECETFVTILDFLTTFLEAENIEKTEALELIFSTNLFSLVTKCALEPQTVGFDMKNLTITDQLPGKLEKLFVCGREKLSVEQKETMFEQINGEIKRIFDWFDAFTFGDFVTRYKEPIDTRIIRGLILLSRCKFLDFLELGDQIKIQKDAKLSELFNIFKHQEEGVNKCVEIDQQIKVFLENCLELFLDDQVPIVKIKNLISSKIQLVRDDGRVITHGEYFFSIFQEVFIRCSANKIEESVQALIDMVYEEADIVFFFLEELTIWLEHHKSLYPTETKTFARNLLKNFNKLYEMVNLATREKPFNNIYKIIVQFLDNLSNIQAEYPDFYNWILTELTKNTDLSDKTRILNDFLLCLTSENSRDNPGLLVVLKSLKNHCDTTTPENLAKNSLESIKTLECFQTLMKMLPITKSIILFESAIIFSQGIGKFISNSTTLNHLTLFMNLATPQTALKSLELVYRIFMTNHTSTERLDILKNFLLPTFKACPSSTILSFFEHKIDEIFKLINKNNPDNPVDCERMIVSKIGCYNILEYLFFKVEERKINQPDGVISLRVFGEVNPGKPLIEQIFRATLNVRKLGLNNDINKEHMRLLHCAAYNCCITIASKTTSNKYYLSLFAENPKADQLIWKKIIDCEKQYKLSQTFKSYPKHRKTVITIKDKLKKQKNNLKNYSYIKSYNLASSTLNEDIYAYDLSEIIPIKEAEDDGMLLTLEEDDINSHECMSQICGIFKYMTANDLKFTEGKNNWLDSFAASMSSEYRNVRLFLLKVVLNNQKVFRPVAERILEPIIETITKILNDGNLNYVVTDGILVLVDWAEIAVPKNNGIQKANAMFCRFVDKVDAGTPAEYIVRNNFNIMDLLVKVWAEFLEIPIGLEEKMRDKPARAIRVILIMLSRNMADKVTKRDDILEFLITYVEKNWQGSEEDVLRSCESIGLFLKFLEGEENFEDRKTIIVDKIHTALTAVREPTRLVKCVNAVSKAYPEIAINFSDFVLRNHLKLAALHKAKSMEVFYHMLPKMNYQEIIEEMRQLKFEGLLKDKVLHCEIICLEIIKRLIEILTAKDFLPLAKLASVYSQHDHQDHRKIVYEIFISIYKKYVKDISLDHYGERLIDLSKQILLPGLLEPSESLQEILTQFWTQEIQFSDNCPDRILDILDIYSPQVEGDFLPVLGIIFLHLSKKSPDYEKKMFEPLDANCDQQNYKILVSWRMKNLTHKVPLFASSYASLYTQRSTLSTLDNFVATNDGFMLRATNSPQFMDTFINDTTMPPPPPEPTIRDDDDFVVPKTPSNNVLSKRFLNQYRDPGFKRKPVTDHYARGEKNKKQAMQQRTSVKLNRGYRYGDFPDTEITHESILKPFQELIKKDQIICKNFIVSMMNSVINRLAASRQVGSREKYQNFINKLSKKFSLVLENRRGNGLIITAIFEILIQNSGIDFDANLVAHVAKVTGLDGLGAVLLEKQLLKEPDDQPVSKRIRMIDGSCASSSLTIMDQWVQLAELYESVNDVDIFLSIFQNHVAGIELHKASRARAACKWDEALESYKISHATETRAIKRHCQQGIYECLARLSNWQDLADTIENDFGADKTLRDFLNQSKSPENGWATSWYFQTRLYLYQSNPDEHNAFRLEVNELTKAPDSEELLQDLFGHELAFLWSFDRQEETKEQIRIALKKIRDQWIQLSNLSYQLKASQVVKLRGLANVDVVTKVAKDLANVEEVLLKYWEESRPSQHDDLLLWDIHLNHRANFGRLLKHQLTEGNDHDSQEHNLADAIDKSIIKQILSLSDATLKQKNLPLLINCLLNAEFYERTIDFKSEFVLKKAEGSLQETQRSSDKIQAFTKTWKRCHQILKMRNDSVTEIQSKISALQVLSDMSLSLKKFSFENQQDFNKVTQKIGTIEDFDVYSFNKLREACGVAEENRVDDKIIADCHLRILKYCYMKIIDGDVGPGILKSFVGSTLKAMAHGLQEAGQYFPCLLKPEYLDDQEIRVIFEEACTMIPSWRFLSWQPQLLLHLSSSLESLITPIIERLAQDYPNALVYTLRVISDTNPELENSPIIHQIKQQLPNIRKVEEFIEALNFLVRPELYLEYHLKDLLKNLSQGRHTVVDKIMKNVYNFSADNSSKIHGDLYKKVTNKYRGDIELIKEMNVEVIKDHVYKILVNLKKSLTEKRDSEYLEDYSPWLNNFSGSDLEIPGQYSGDKKPLPQYHAKITKIESKIKVMQSLRRPVNITMVGNDAKNYNFLVKFGEDLGLDQTVEAAFNTMNDILKINSSCAQKNLSISTYQVIPLSGSLGLIQWIDETKTLEDYINFTLNKTEKQELERVLKDYENWIRQASPGSTNLVVQYKEALLKYEAEDVINKMNDLINRTNWDMLRRTFVKINPSIESFIFSRRNFIITYATMCAGQWILGVGDRHLKNILISIESGRCTGIDFNAAFGGGIDQSVPELVPFRLTNQLKSLFKPFDEHDLFGATMIHVIRALREGKGPILTSIDGIAHRKLSTLEGVRRQLGGKVDNYNWVPEKKINSVLKKLEGRKPSEIMMEDLEMQHRDEYYEKYRSIVEGSDGECMRFRMDKDLLSPEEQVKCLLEQATDLNILGRTYGPWMPWL